MRLHTLTPGCSLFICMYACLCMTQKLLIPAASKTPPVTIKGAGHFLQEQKGEEIGAECRKFIQAN